MPRLPNERWDAAAVAAMHTEFARTREPQLRARLTVVYQPFARHFALRYRNSSEPLDDLVQVAMLGLVNAIDRYDPSRGSFRSYAGRIIIGELKRHFRDKTWAVHVPRGLQERALLVRDSVGPLRQRLGRTPTTAEVAAHVGLAEEDVLEAMDVFASYRARSLDAPTAAHDRNERSHDVATVESGFDRVETEMARRRTVAKLLDALAEEDRELVRLYYGEGLTQTEVAEKLGVSQVSVSRHLRRVVSRLRVVAAAMM
jgi:RNA polymerase sigma-B factor